MGGASTPSAVAPHWDGDGPRGGPATVSVAGCGFDTWTKRWDSVMFTLSRWSGDVSTGGGGAPRLVVLGVLLSTHRRRRPYRLGGRPAVGVLLLGVLRRGGLAQQDRLASRPPACRDHQVGHRAGEEQGGGPQVEA